MTRPSCSAVKQYREQITSGLFVTPQTNHVQFVRPCLGLLNDPLTPQPRRNGALFTMPSRQPAHIHAARPCSGQRNHCHEKRVCLLCRQAGKSCMQSTCKSRTPSTVSGSQPRGPVYSACGQGVAGGGTRNQATQRGPARHDATTPQQTHAARTNARRPRTCSASQAMQIRPESRRTGFAESPYIHHAQRITKAVSGHFKRFSDFPAKARQCSARHPRPAARS